MILVPLYDTLGEEGVKFILNQTELPFLFAHPKTLKSYLSYLPECPAVKLMVKIPSLEVQDVTEEERSAAQKHGVELVTWAEFIKRGADDPKPMVLPGPEDTCTLCYTSGTTG